MHTETDTTAVLHQSIDETPFLAVERHIESIKPAHIAAFNGPVRRDYQAGEVVWMWDHYNTGIVTGPSSRADSWTVTTSDADGEVDTYEYRAAHIKAGRGSGGVPVGDRRAGGAAVTRPFGPCERDAEGRCLGKCGRRGHLGRPLTIAEWLSFFGPDVPGSPASVGRLADKAVRR